jgi:hypothetical protein
MAANKTPELTAERARDILDYNQDTGVLTWRPRTPDMCKGTSARSAELVAKCWNSNDAGHVAGSIDPSGYIRICIDGGRYWAHRVIWLMTTGDWPKGRIDHDDLNRSNNKWTNLRVSTASTNGANRIRSKNNTSGFKGVSYDKNRKKYIASIGKDSKAIHLGRFDDPREAAAVYEKAAKELFGDFARVA